MVTRSGIYRGVAVVAIALAGYAGLRALREARTVDEREGKRVAVCQAARDLLLGERVGVSECAPTQLRTGVLPPDPIRSAAHLDGRVVTTPLLRGTIITERHLAPRDRRATDAVVPVGMRIVRVAPADEYTPTAGALVDVLTVPEAPFGAGPTATVVARRATVINDPNPGDQPSVLLVVTPDQAQRIATARASGTITLALTAPDEGRSNPTTP